MRWTREIFLSRGACHVSSQEHTVSCTRYADATTRERKIRHLMCRTTLANFTLCRPKTHTCGPSWNEWGYIKAKLKTSPVVTRIMFSTTHVNLRTYFEKYSSHSQRTKFKSINEKKKPNLQGSYIPMGTIVFKKCLCQ